MNKEKIRVLFVFRKPSRKFHSIENLFASVQKYLPEGMEYENMYLPCHEGVICKMKNILFVLNNRRKFKEFDVIHVTGDITYITPFISGNKVVTFHDLGSLLHSRAGLTKKILELLWVKLPVKAANIVTVISPSTRQEVLQIIQKAGKKIKYVPNCIDDTWYKESTPIRKTPKYVLAIGTKKNKNLERIIKACSGLDVVLTIVGSLSKEQWNQLDKSGLEYAVWSTLSYNEIKRLYSQTDIVAFPSLYEGFGLPILEAQAQGIPLITSNIEPMTSIAGQGALKVNPYDDKDIRMALVELLNDYQLRQKISQLGKENVKQYFCSHISAEYAKLYNKLTQ